LRSSQIIEIKTARRTELVNITDRVQTVVASSGVLSGLCHLYVPHTTAGITVNEAYDPDVARDIEVTLDRLIPKSGDYKHDEGNSDSHVKAAFVGVSQSVWIEDGKLALGRWQGIFFCEFDGPRTRHLRIRIVSD
jgi:secondary thiamine-phosphate synthase enzyme